MSKILINENDEVFSDPDILISKKNKKPKNINEADWYSQTFGNDIITIPSKDLVNLKTLYVGRYVKTGYITKGQTIGNLTKDLQLRKNNSKILLLR